ncbi:MAG TPA: DUF3800 domain-containing protein [Candidatus Fraserbacteria bacterium]|nr:DUF3800 domain-containing protein [Candidatus Fraserbacteria bacterium]
MTSSKSSVRHYFVDEGGDGALFSRKGQVLVGTTGCSRFFMLGLLDVPDSPALHRELQALRQRLLADPYFQDVPSMQPQERKTAVAFHAKDDLPEVRREVFALLQKAEDLRFFGVVTDKLRAVEYIQQRNMRDSNYRYHPNEMYDYLARRLFRDRLHQDDEYYICFAKRGKSDRTQALSKAVERARQRFYERWGIASNASISIAVTPKQNAGLQAVDYFLWALQRLYERSEDRYVRYLWGAFKLIHDIDDVREKPYGVYYTQRNPLTTDALKWRR